MILWQSLHVEVNRDTHGQASTSGDDDQHELLPGTLDDQQGSAAPDAAATYDRLPDSGWAVLPRGRSPKVDRCRRRTDCARRGKRRAPRSAAASRANLPACVDHLRGDDGSC